MVTDSPAEVLTMEAKLCLAQDAFRKFHTMCFWYMREDLIVTEKDLPAIVKGLRQNGNFETYQIVGRLCH